MQFDILNKETENTVVEIQKKIKQRKNGVTSDAMRDAGIVYALNYGVAIPHLRDVAKGYAPDNNVAAALWNLKWRESMILASMLFNANDADFNLLETMVNEAHTEELFQQLGMNLLASLDDNQQKIIEFIESGSTQKLCVACYALVKCTGALKNNTAYVSEVIHLLKKAAKTLAQWPEINAVSKAIARIGAYAVAQQQEVLDLFKEKSGENRYWKMAYETVKTEFEYRT